MSEATKTANVGRIDPDAMYTTEGCMIFAGLGRESIKAARKTKLVRPVRVGRRDYYRGDEIIAWLLSRRKDRVK